MRLFKKVLSAFTVFVLFGLVVSPPSAMAVPVIPPVSFGHIFVQDGTVPVDVIFVSGPSDLSLFSDIRLVGSPTVLFDTSTAILGDAVSLGIFTAGTELEFSLTRHIDGITFFSGTTLNPDGEPHAALDTTDPLFPIPTTVVYFEEIDSPLSVGPFDYTDAVFAVTNTATTSPLILPPPPIPVPEPSTLLLVSMGFGAMILKRKQN